MNKDFIFDAKIAQESVQDSEDHKHRIVSSEAVLEKEMFGYDYETPVIGEDSVIVASWHVGGAQGGDCWGGEAHSYTRDVREPDLLVLDRLLEEVAPDVTFLHYKKILAKVKMGDHTEYEYYGNSEKYSYIYISLKEVYETLRDLGYDV